MLSCGFLLVPNNLLSHMEVLSSELLRPASLHISPSHDKMSIVRIVIPIFLEAVMVVLKLLSAIG
jgi:hypothetical protein